MMEKLTIVDCLKKLYDLENSYLTYCNDYASEDDVSMFNKYVEFMLDKYLKLVKSIDHTILEEAIEKMYYWNGKRSKVRFVNLISKIEKEIRKILLECYYPNPTMAFAHLEKLLGNGNKKLMNYLEEPLINYCNYRIKYEDTFYRIRISDNGKSVSDCWYIPFKYRANAACDRYSKPGFPCLYMSKEVETCVAEVSNKSNSNSHSNSNRDLWLGSFKYNKSTPLILLDVRIPTALEIERLSDDEKLRYIITYPLRLLCSIPVLPKDKDKTYHEEYLFPQTLMHLLSMPTDENNGLGDVTGIIYDSTKHKGGVNVAFSVEYKEFLSEIGSFCKPKRKLKDIFKHDPPKKY